MVAIKYYLDLMSILIEGTSPDDFDLIWDDFWKLSGFISEIKVIEWCDPDTTYYEDIMARYNSIVDYVDRFK